MDPIIATHETTCVSLTDHYSIMELPYGKLIINSHDPCLPINVVENIREIQSLCQFAHGVVLDVGANIGTHSINFSRTAQLVYAIEPFPTTYYNLCANILLNNCTNILPYQFALGRVEGHTSMFNIDPTRRNSAMGLGVGQGNLPVVMHTIDALELNPLHFIKIDVEGYELEVLEGARKTLGRENLIVFVEIHSAQLLDPILALMAEYHYHMFEYVRTEYGGREGDITGATFGYLFWKEGRIQWGK